MYGKQTGRVTDADAIGFDWLVRLRRKRLFARFATAAALLAVSGCSFWSDGDEKRGALSNGLEPSAVVPPRSSEYGFKPVSTVTLWRRSRGSPALTKVRASAKHAAYVVVGLRGPRSQRGVWGSRVLLKGSERRRAREAVLSIRNVHLLGEDPILPALALQVDTRATLSKLRASRFVDYVEPLRVRCGLSEIGCGKDLIDPSTSAKAAPGDVLPWIAPLQHVVEAWRRVRRRPGLGVTVAVLDTGVQRGQTQLQMPQFASGRSIGRTVVNLGSNSWGGGDTPWGICNHGTRIAGLIAAPRDGRNVVGVAWAANLITVNSHSSVVVGDGNALWIARGMRMARARGARVFEMEPNSGRGARHRKRPEAVPHLDYRSSDTHAPQDEPPPAHPPP